MKPIRLKPASCLVLAAFGSVALMPLDQTHAQECKKKPDAPREVFEVDLNGPQADFGIVVTEHEVTERDLIEVDPNFVERALDEPIPVEPLEAQQPIDTGDVKPEDSPKEFICSRTRAMPQAINPAFTTNLYQQLRAKEGNVFFSPCSITQAMGMAYMGAKGDTAAEFAKALSLGGPQESLPGQMEQWRNTLHSSANVKDDKLNIANALCVTGQVPLQSYQDLVRQQFGGELFAGGLEEINGWVDKKTEGRIKKILEELDPNSACMLLNAVYFKGSWKDPFSPFDTRIRDFHVTADKSVKVPMMTRKGRYAVVRNEQYIAVELPYQTSCSMVLMMPAKAEGFEKFEAGMNDALVTKVCRELKGKKREIELAMPKFKIETKYDLVPAMKQLGLAKAFDMEQADFSAMYERDDIAIGQIVHKATLEVDEQGSVATAATGIAANSYSASMPTPAIHFDRPFLVLIRENNTNTTLFMGRISDPTK